MLKLWFKRNDLCVEQCVDLMTAQFAIHWGSTTIVLLYQADIMDKKHIAVVFILDVPAKSEILIL